MPPNKKKKQTRSLPVILNASIDYAYVTVSAQLVTICRTLLSLTETKENCQKFRAISHLTHYFPEEPKKTRIVKSSSKECDRSDCPR